MGNVFYFATDLTQWDIGNTEFGGVLVRLERSDLGLDHFEGRSWRGFHHQLVLAAVAYIFVLLAHLESKRILGIRGKQCCERFSRGLCGQ